MENQTENYRQIVYEVIEALINDYELPEIELTDDTLLIDSLGLTSIDIMHVLSSIDMRVSKHLPYDNLVIQNDEYISDISVKQIIDFIDTNINETQNEPKNIFENR
jgi:acyl carrier protein